VDKFFFLTCGSVVLYVFIKICLPKVLKP